MPLVPYRFSQAVSGFYEIPSDVAETFLPNWLTPIELRHHSSILSVTAFDFTESLVGAYQELVFAIIVPWWARCRLLPKVAVFPFLVATSSLDSRLHAREYWHLPHYDGDICVTFRHDSGMRAIAVSDSQGPILDMSVAAHPGAPVDHLYQCFTIEGDSRYKIDIRIQGTYAEHEEEEGEMLLHEHSILDSLAMNDRLLTPFREMWMEFGQQVFSDIEEI